MSLLRFFAYGSVVSTFSMIVLGGYVSSTGSGNACPDWPLCYGQVVPPLAGTILIEYTHRLFALVVTSFVLATMLLAWTRFRAERSILILSTASFLLLAAQILLGMVTVQSRLDPVVSTAHLGVASGVLSLVVANAVNVRNLTLRERNFGTLSRV